MPVKIMLIIATKGLSGPMKGVLQLLENMDSAEYEVSLYGFQITNREEDPLVSALRDRRIPVKLLIQKKGSYLSLCRQVVREIREGGVDVLQTHGFKPTFLGFVARLFCRVKWVCFMHGSTSENFKVRMYNALDSILQRWADRTVLVSESQRQKILGGRNTQRVRVLHNAVDIMSPMPVSADGQPVRDRLAIPNASRIVAAVGRFSPEKGIDVLLEAFAMLVRQVDNVHLVLVGDGQERSALEGQSAGLGIDGMVHFVGHSQTPGDYVAEADLLALPSRSEGIPNVVLEAMAMGKPVVATSVGGVPEIVDDGQTGRLVPPERPDLLAQGLAELLADPELRGKLASEGRRRVREAFSVEARVAKMQILYRDILAGG